MVLGRMIRFNSGGIAHGQGLASGVEIQNLPQAQAYVQKVMRRSGRLPKSASPQSVMNADKVAAAMKANAGFLKDLVAVKLEQVDAGLEVMDAAIQLDEGLQQREIQYQRKMDNHSRKRLDAQYQLGRLQSANEGNHAAYVRQSAFDAL